MWRIEHSTHPLESRVVGVPRYNGNPEVTGELKEVLGARGATTVLFVVHQVEYRRDVDREKLVTQRVKDRCNRR